MRRKGLSNESEFLKQFSIAPNPESPGFYFREYEYQYMNCGLLMKRFDSKPSDDTNKLAAELFDYKFW